MDERLVSWGRAVKSRFRARPPALPSPALPPLWLFSDPARMDILASVAALPPGLCGVVFRHDGVPGRAALLRAVARLCRARRIALVVAGPADGVGCGRHLRGSRRADVKRRAKGYPLTSSAHGAADLVRARRAGAGCAFLSPAFPTASHPGAPALGAVRWAGLARCRGIQVLALGGIDGASVRRLPRHVRGAGAIGALSAGPVQPAGAGACCVQATVFHHCHATGVPTPGSRLRAPETLGNTLTKPGCLARAKSRLMADTIGALG